MLTLTSSGPIFATASIGVSSSRQLGFNIDNLRAAARQSLEQAQARGGNRVASFTDDPADQGQSAKLGEDAALPSSLERAAALR